MSRYQKQLDAQVAKCKQLLNEVKRSSNSRGEYLTDSDSDSSVFKSESEEDGCFASAFMIIKRLNKRGNKELLKRIATLET